MNYVDSTFIGYKLPQPIDYIITCYDLNEKFELSATEVKSINESFMFYEYEILILAVPIKNTIVYKKPIL